MNALPLVLAHRGGSLEAPENTLPAFRHALAAGADGVECDVHLTRDGAVVVHHDPDLRPAPDPAAPRRRIDGLTLAEVRRCDLGWTHGPRFAGLVAPTLEEFLDLPFAGREIMIEIKGGGDEDALGAAVARLVAASRWRDACVCGSFSARIVRAVRAAEPRLRLQAIADAPEALAAFDGLPLRGIAIDRAIATPELVAREHARSRAVWTWTVKAEDQVPSLLAAGVDGLITDLPARILRWLGR